MLLIVFISYTLLNFRIASKVSNKRIEEILITGNIFQAASIIVSGYILSALNIWHSEIAWSILPFFISFFIYYLFKDVFNLPETASQSTFKLIGASIQKLHEAFINQRKTEKTLFAVLFIGVVVVVSSQVFLFFSVPPNEWDSMTGHLNRILYFVQNHTTNHFIGTNWNIDTYPKSFSSIQFYPFLMTGFNEHFFKIPNLIAFWILALSIYAILKQLKFNFKLSLLIACLPIFTPILIIQSTSTDTDIVLACYLSTCVYFLIRYLNTKESYYLYLFSFAFAIGLSHKITWVFSVPSLLVLLGYVITQNMPIRTRLLFKHGIVGIVFVTLITLPTGYIANLKYYNHPIGPVTATKHQSIERAGNFKSLLLNGSRNVVRYTFDLLNLDGLRNIPAVEKFQDKINDNFRKIDQSLHLNLEIEKTFTIIPFSFNRQFEFVNGTPIYGSLFILFLIPSIVLLFLRRRQPILYLFFIAFVLHFAALAFTAAYDPWKGRYMISSLVFLLPVSSIFINKLVSANRYSLLLLAYILIIASAWSTILYHGRSALISTHNLPTIWGKTRMELLTVSRPDITKAYANFDKLVPQNATVALATINDDYEYPLWGKRFTRKLIPINPFEQGLQAIPKEANYLFFSKNVIKPLPGDIRLGTDTTIREHIIVRGEDYYLRKLK